MDVITRIGNAQELFDAQVNQMVAKRALPEVVAFLTQKRGTAQAKEDLRLIASLITYRLLFVWHPKSRHPFKVLKEMMNLFFGNNKIKGKVLEKIKSGKPSKISIRDYNCPICPEKKGETVVIKGIHYCVAISGSIESILNYLVESKLVDFKEAKCETVKSTGSGDKYCEHILTLDYGTGV